MFISDVIIERINANQHRFYANDNVSQFINEGELPSLEDELTKRFEDVLHTLLIDWKNDPNSKNTPRRLAKMYIHELMRGRFYPAPKVTAFPNEKEMFVRADNQRPAYSYSGLLVVPAEITSMCSHHHSIVRGMVYIGILPGDRVIGLSKYVRLAQWLARRGTLQEQLTEDIMKEIQKASGTKDVAVVSVLTHGCMSCRGIEEYNPYVSSAELGGRFYDEPELRSELYKHIDLIEEQRRRG